MAKRSIILFIGKIFSLTRPIFKFEKICSGFMEENSALTKGISSFGLEKCPIEIQSIVPSLAPSINASLSSSVLRGGLSLKLLLNPSITLSV